MPTFYDPVADAAEAADALRGLAHASRSFEHPEDAYGMIGDLLAGVRSLHQTVQQLADRHARDDGRAFDDHDDQAAGIHDARLAAARLTDAATALDQVEDHLNTAMSAAGRIAWHPAPATEATTAEATGPAGPASRWVNVVFLQGDQAEAALWLIDRDGPDAAIDHLSHYDYGQETTDAAMENGYVYDTPPTSALDREHAAGDYTMIHNPDLRHVALYRRHEVAAADHIDTDARSQGIGGPATRAGVVTGAGAVVARALGARSGKRPDPDQIVTSTRGKSWFAHPGIEAVKHDRGLGR